MLYGLALMPIGLYGALFLPPPHSPQRTHRLVLAERPPRSVTPPVPWVPAAAWQRRRRGEGCGLCLSVLSPAPPPPGRALPRFPRLHPHRTEFPKQLEQMCGGLGLWPREGIALPVEHATGDAQDPPGAEPCRSSQWDWVGRDRRRQDPSPGTPGTPLPACPPRKPPVGPVFR